MRLLECLYVECSPVLDAAIQATHMDEVKAFLCKEPFFTAVADLEGQIWRDPRWLNWRKIGSDDACGRMLVGEVTMINPLTLHFFDIGGSLMVIVDPHIAQIPVPVPTSRTRYFPGSV
jgi:hypothetical protein